jgi:hypothetical protein
MAGYDCNVVAVVAYSDDIAYGGPFVDPPPYFLTMLEICTADIQSSPKLMRYAFYRGRVRQGLSMKCDVSYLW